jgi:outer membrane protein TolC
MLRAYLRRLDGERRTASRLGMVALIAACGATAAAAQPLPTAVPQRLPEKTLSECIAIALEHHPTLKAAAASIDAAHERIWEAASPYFPQVNAFYSELRQQTSVAAQTQTASGTVISNLQVSNFFSTGATFSQVLFDFGQTLASIRWPRRASARSRTTQHDARHGDPGRAAGVLQRAGYPATAGVAKRCARRPSSSRRRKSPRGRGGASSM